MTNDEDQQFFAIAERKFEERLRLGLRGDSPNLDRVRTMFVGYGAFLENNPEALLYPNIQPQPHTPRFSPTGSGSTSITESDTT